MAKIYNGYMGAVVGKLGTAVGFIWKGRPVMRAYVRHIRYPDTAQQQAERDWFVAMVRFAAAARPALLLGLKAAAAREQMTEGNLFVKRNKGCFGRDGRACDYRRMRLADGMVAPVNAVGSGVDDEGVLTVDFERRSHMPRERSDDSVYLYVYNARERSGLLTAAVRRGSGRVAVALPDGWGADVLHCWLLAVDGKGEASVSTYVEPAAVAAASDSGDGRGERPAPQGAESQPDTAEAAGSACCADTSASAAPPW